MTNFTDRQQQIIQASLDIIANSGIHGLTIKNISKKVGISEPAIYRHFESKTDILLGIIAKMKESSSVNIFVSVDETQNTVDIIRNAFITRAKRFAKNPSIAAVIFSEAIFENNSQLAEAIESIMIKSQMKFSNIIKKGQSKGEIVDFVDAEQLALLIIGAFRLLVTKWHMSKNSFDLVAQTTILFNTLEKII
ncbi:MAG: TetR family transcriptional regulator [Planctomycetia bacterium]|nr:TetR family transcriptional regulator [Planctomycetia bacterium]